jgi:hypothetical protein
MRDGADMTDHQGNRRSSILVPGILGALGAFLIVIADVVYNVFDGDRLGRTLYISTYFGIFLFPLWWGGIWVMHEGLRPAGRIWSFYPCLMFAVFVSTINVSQPCVCGSRSRSSGAEPCSRGEWRC